MQKASRCGFPRGLHGLTGDQAGPERGVTISLASGASITVFGELNILEHRTAAEGIRDSLSQYCASGKPVISAARVGKVRGAKARVACGERMIVEMLASRPGGGPIYRLTLQTTRAHATADLTDLLYQVEC